MLLNRLEIICIIHQYTCIGIIRIINLEMKIPDTFIP